MVWSRRAVEAVRALVLAAPCAVAACGGTTTGPGVDAVADAGAPPALVLLDAAPPLRPARCQVCYRPSDCGALGTCVGLYDGDGGVGICAPGCNKDGFCPLNDVCRWFAGPPGEADVRACIPPAGCGDLSVPRRSAAYPTAP